MPRENPAFRDNLQDILEFFGGRRVLNLTDVRNYTGLSDNRTVKHHFPFNGNIISAVTLARCLAGGDSDG